MSMTTLISQRPAGDLSARALEVVANATPATFADNATTMFPNPAYMTSTHMAWLGDVDENVCFSGKNDSKRITPGRLDRYLT